MSGQFFFISAGAGSGKTYRLVKELSNRLTDTRRPARPDRILITTFTRKAAADLQDRTRQAMFQLGRPDLANSLLASRIGTVHSLCESIVRDAAFRLGQSPQPAVADESSSAALLVEACAAALQTTNQTELVNLLTRLPQVDLASEVRLVIQAARVAGRDLSDLREDASRAVDAWKAFLSAPSPADLADLRDEYTHYLSEVRHSATKKAWEARVRAQRAFADLYSESGTRWRALEGMFAKDAHPGKDAGKLFEILEPKLALHPHTPEFLEDSSALIRLIYTLAERSIEAYHDLKRERGLLDFNDLEALALQALRQPSSMGSLDLVMVDEFQDTSPLQLAIFNELRSQARDTVWVGDWKQSIYAFRGASPALTRWVSKNLPKDAEVGRLDVSYRARPELVRFSNAVFSQVFGAFDESAEDVVLKPRPDHADDTLGASAHWVWLHDKDRHGQNLAKVGFQNVARWLGAALDSGRFSVRADAVGKTNRPANVGDVAILTFRNEDCLKIATALRQAGLPVQLAQGQLLETPEVQLALAAWRLIHRPQDKLAALVLDRLLASQPEDVDSAVARVFAPGEARHSDRVKHMMAVGEARREQGLLSQFDLALNEAGVFKQCRRWGFAEQRLANLDALRANLSRFLKQPRSLAEPASMQAFLNQLSADHQSGDDRQGRLPTTRAITVSTFHASKGLEWPVVVLMRLDKSPGYAPYGVKTIMSPGEMTLSDPLRGLWVRSWPNLYSKRDSKPARRLTDRYVKLEDGQNEAWQHQQEQARLLYVIWTRARDHVVLVTPSGTMKHGLGDLLPDMAVTVEAPQLGETKQAEAQIGDESFPITLTQLDQFTEVVPLSPPANSWVPEPEQLSDFPPAVISPSGEHGQPGQASLVATLGDRIRIPEIDQRSLENLGSAIHAYLAAEQRLAGDAERCLSRWGIEPRILTGSSLESIAERFESALQSRWPRATLHREASVRHRLPEGTEVRGAADLLIETDAGWIILDHKSYPGDHELDHAASYLPQLERYAEAVHMATGRAVLDLLIHTTLGGSLIRVTSTKS